MLLCTGEREYSIADFTSLVTYKSRSPFIQAIKNLSWPWSLPTDSRTEERGLQMFLWPCFPYLLSWISSVFLPTFSILEAYAFLWGCYDGLSILTLGLEKQPGLWTLPMLHEGVQPLCLWPNPGVISQSWDQQLAALQRDGLQAAGSLGGPSSQWGIPMLKSGGWIWSHLIYRQGQEAQKEALGCFLYGSAYSELQY